MLRRLCFCTILCPHQFRWLQRLPIAFALHMSCNMILLIDFSCYAPVHRVEEKPLTPAATTESANQKRGAEVNKTLYSHKITEICKKYEFSDAVRWTLKGGRWLGILRLLFSSSKRLQNCYLRWKTVVLFFPNVCAEHKWRNPPNYRCFVVLWMKTRWSRNVTEMNVIIGRWRLKPGIASLKISEKEKLNPSFIIDPKAKLRNSKFWYLLIFLLCNESETNLYKINILQ